MTATIPLSRGKFAIVSHEDFERLSQFSWHASPTSTGRHYAARSDGRTTIYMHREVLGAQRGQEVDHINRDGLDNRRLNLRFASRLLQSINQPARRKRTPELFGLRGVFRAFSGEHKGWKSQIAPGGRRIVGRLRQCPIQAAIDYDRMAVEIFGENAALNFPCRLGQGMTVAPRCRRRVPIGEKHSQSKLSASQAAEILASDEPAQVLAERHGVHRNTIGDVRAGRTWTHLSRRKTVEF